MSRCMTDEHIQNVVAQSNLMQIRTIDVAVLDSFPKAHSLVSKMICLLFVVRRNARSNKMPNGRTQLCLGHCKATGSTMIMARALSGKAGGKIRAKDHFRGKLTAVVGQALGWSFTFNHDLVGYIEQNSNKHVYLGIINQNASRVSSNANVNLLLP